MATGPTTQRNPQNGNLIFPVGSSVAPAVPSRGGSSSNLLSSATSVFSRYGFEGTSPDGTYVDGKRLGLLYTGQKLRSVVATSQAAADHHRFLRECALTLADVSREMSAPYFEANPRSPINRSVVFVPCSIGDQPLTALPLRSLWQLLTAELYNRRSPGSHTVCLIGHELARRTINRPTLEDLARVSEFAHRVTVGLLQRHRDLFSTISGVFDTDIFNDGPVKGFVDQQAKHNLLTRDWVATAVRALQLSTGGDLQLKFGCAPQQTQQLLGGTAGVTKGLLELHENSSRAVDQLLKGQMAFVYVPSETSARLSRLNLAPRTMHNANWLAVSHLDVSDTDLQERLAEQQQISNFFDLVHELDPSLTTVDDSLQENLTRASRMLAMCQDAVDEALNSRGQISQFAYRSVVREFDSAMRLYLSAASERNAVWLKQISKELGFETTHTATTEPSSVIKSAA